jgi:hypothetical protein
MAVTVSGFTRTVTTCVIPGGAAGTHVVHGDLDASGDTLLSVRHCSASLVTNTDLTSEFSITGHNTIANVGGTSTANNFLVVTWAKATTE